MKRTATHSTVSKVELRNQKLRADYGIQINLGTKPAHALQIVAKKHKTSIGKANSILGLDK